MKTPKITIITPCFNASRYLEATFCSVIAQTFQDWEWIIVDDLSQDGSWQILESFKLKDDRIRIFQNSVNSGASVSRNKGLDEAMGEYIAFLDADDLWMPNKLEKQLNFMAENELKMTCHSYQMMNNQHSTPIRLPHVVRLENIKAYNPLATSFMMVKRDLLNDLRFDPSARRRQDWIFWYHLIEKQGKCVNLSDILGIYRKDSVSSISKNKIKMAFIQWKLYRTYFKQGLFESILSFVKYAIYGITKHYL